MKDDGHKAEALMAKGSIYRNSDNEAEEKVSNIRVSFIKLTDIIVHKSFSGSIWRTFE